MSSSSQQTGESRYCDDPNFCGECGAILPLPALGKDFLLCGLCKSRWPATEAINKVVWTCCEKYERPLNDKGVSLTAADGPQVDRTCIKCGNSQMAYTTRQTRSADEGMTVFFTCVHCGHRDIEYS